MAAKYFTGWTYSFFSLDKRVQQTFVMKLYNVLVSKFCLQKLYNNWWKNSHPPCTISKKGFFYGSLQKKDATILKLFILLLLFSSTWLLHIENFCLASFKKETILLLQYLINYHLTLLLRWHQCGQFEK